MSLEEDMEVFRQRARDHKWAEPQAYNYAVATANMGENTENIPWFSNARKYEWKDEYGDVAPRDEELERELFHNTYITSQGDRMENLTKFTVSVSGPVVVEPVREVC
jgi:ATP-dependent RNA helicase DDX3X